MNNYIGLLSNEELEQVCLILGGSALKTLYKQNIKLFNKLKPGFRPDRLSDEVTVKFAVQNRSENFIGSFVNVWINLRINEIKQYYSERISDETEDYIALIDTLSHSVFSSCPALYFKLTETDPPVADATLFFYAIKLASEKNDAEMNATSVKTSSNAVDVEALEEKHKEETDEIKSGYEEQLSSARQKEEELLAEVERLNGIISTIEADFEAARDELRELRFLSSYTVEPESYEPADGYHFASLCSCYFDDFGRDRLLRIADIRDSEFSERLLEAAPEYRNLYRKDGPAREGYIGVWDWKTVPNVSDPTRDYIVTAYNDRIKPVEVCVVKECQDVQDLIAHLKSGLSVELHTDRVVFAIYLGNGYEGVYCETSSLEQQSGRILLKADVIKLPVYAFSRNDIIKFDDVCIMSSPGIGMPTRLIRVKNPMEIIRDRIVSRASWAAAKQSGFVRNEYSQVKDFLLSLPTSDLYEDLSEVCDCSIAEAETLVAEFFKHTDSVISGDTLENSVMAQIIRNDPKLYQACLDELGEDWRAHNETVINEAKESLAAIKAEEFESIEACKIKERELSDIEAKITLSQASLAEKEQLAKDVETLVFERIERAKSNAAEFIAEQAFIQAAQRDKNQPQVSDIELVCIEESAFTGSELFVSEDPDVNEKYEDLLLSIQNELLEAGVKDTYAVALSALLYAAYVERIPVLLAGPNSYEVVEAFSIAMNCHIPAVLDCGNSYSSNAITACEKSSEEIIVIKQPFQNDWRNAIVEMLSKREHFYFIVHPFAEDLIVEPKGLFNYCIPVLTDMFIEGAPTKKYVGGKLSSSFAHLHSSECFEGYDNIVNEIRAGAMARYNVRKLSADIQKLLGVDNDTVFRLLLYPLAFALGEISEFMSVIEDAEYKPSKMLLDEFRQLTGVDE